METVLVSLFTVIMLIVCTLGMANASLTAASSISETYRDIETQSNTIQWTSINAEHTSDQGTALVISVANEGQTDLGEFDLWTVIAERPGQGPHLLPYNPNSFPGSNEWGVKQITLTDGRPEVFDPGILNPGEVLELLIELDPPLEEEDVARITLATPNGVRAQCLVLK